MNEFPLQVIFGRNLIELFFDERNVFVDLIHAPVDVVGPNRGAGRTGSVNGHAQLLKK